MQDSASQFNTKISYVLFTLPLTARKIIPVECKRNTDTEQLLCLPIRLRVTTCSELRFSLRSSTSSQTLRQTRSQSFDGLILPHVHTRYGLHSISFLAADRWNSLPADLRTAQSPRLFRTSTLDWLGYPVRTQVCGAALEKYEQIIIIITPGKPKRHLKPISLGYYPAL